MKIYGMETWDKISAGADGGPCSQVCARLTLRSTTPAEILRHTCFLAISGDSKHFSLFEKNLNKQEPA